MMRQRKERRRTENGQLIRLLLDIRFTCTYSNTVAPKEMNGVASRNRPTMVASGDRDNTADKRERNSSNKMNEQQERKTLPTKIEG